MELKVLWLGKLRRSLPFCLVYKPCNLRLLTSSCWRLLAFTQWLYLNPNCLEYWTLLDYSSEVNVVSAKFLMDRVKVFYRLWLIRPLHNAWSAVKIHHHSSFKIWLEHWTACSFILQRIEWNEFSSLSIAVFASVLMYCYHYLTQRPLWIKNIFINNLSTIIFSKMEVFVNIFTFPLEIT